MTESEGGQILMMAALTTIGNLKMSANRQRLTFQEKAILAFLMTNDDGYGPRAIQVCFQMAPSSVSETVCKLKKHKLVLDAGEVKRGRGSQMRYKLTKAGRAEANDFCAAVRSRFASLVGKDTETKIISLLEEPIQKFAKQLTNGASFWI